VLRICKDGSSKIPGVVLPTVVEGLEKGTSSRCLSVVVASWISFIEKQKEQNVPLEDGEGPALFALVEAMSSVLPGDDSQRGGGRHDVRVFLSEKRLFGEVGSSEVFVAQVQAAYEEIAAEGVLAAMQRLLLLSAPPPNDK
jgi:mannitol-1-phosphate/altronate dehydrogenase